MYYERLPKYTYDMECGHVFASTVPSEADDCGLHWFYCRSCKTYEAVLHEELGEGRPLASTGRRLGHGEYARRVDAAIHADRTSDYYRRVWDGASVEEVARWLGVSKRTVQKVAADLGVYDPCL